MKQCPVLNEVVAHDLCIGCGACAAACPRHRLSVDFDSRGFYVVREDPAAAACADSCNVCSRVCPFVDGNPNEDAIALELFGDDSGYEPRLGRFRSCYVGSSTRGKQRENGASGGLATWFLTELLRRGEVDRVVCAGRHPGPRPLFAYKICESEQEVEDSSRSAYYPVEMSAVLADLQRVEGRYAIMCLPCFAKAVRLAAGVFPRIRDRLVCVAGLVCGHTVSSFFAEYAAALADPDAGPPSGVIFRTKDSRFPATELGTTCLWEGNRRTVFWSEGLAECWAEHWFTPNPCFYCDDTFAETADVVFMDAWLPEYQDDYRGTSIVVVRSELADRTFRAGASSGDVQIEPCPPDEVLRSQAAAVEFKREGLAHRLAAAQETAVRTPVKRIEPMSAASPERARKWDKQLEAARLGVHAWSERHELRDFQARMQEYGWARRSESAVHSRSLPRRAFGRLRRMLWKHQK